MPQDEELKKKLSYLAGEIEHLRHDFGIDLEEIRAHIATLSTKIEERISPEELRPEVEEIGKLVTDMRLFLSGLMLPWEKKITEAREEKELWGKRIERGEAKLVNEIRGQYAIYRSYVYLPTGETWVETSPY